MLELIKYVVTRFAEKPEEIEYDVQEAGKTVNVTITLSDSDMGKVIGRQGKIAKALRTLVRAGSQKENKKYNIEIKERGENI
ncbi:MAG: KH domain-containing protein [Clostridiales bacterium]|nr:KH domain-containing protein [Clostridiales bacterium]